MTILLHNKSGIPLKRCRKQERHARKQMTHDSQLFPRTLANFLLQAPVAIPSCVIIGTGFNFLCDIFIFKALFVREQKLFERTRYVFINIIS